MELKAFLDLLETVAPCSLAMDGDNAGLIVGTRRSEIRRVLVALDCTAAVAREAAEWGADMVLTHHPLMYRAIRRLHPDDPDTAPIYELIEHGIGMAAMHTNLDAAEGGVNDVLAGLFGIVGAEAFEPDGMGRIGRLAEPASFTALCKTARRVFGSPVASLGPADRTVNTLAVLGGEGGEYAGAAADAGADAYITGEARHHQLLFAAQRGICMIVAGHYQTEHTVLSPLISRLQAGSFEVEYKLASCEKPPNVIA